MTFQPSVGAHTTFFNNPHIPFLHPRESIHHTRQKRRLAECICVCACVCVLTLPLSLNRLISPPPPFSHPPPPSELAAVIYSTRQARLVAITTGTPSALPPQHFDFASLKCPSFRSLSIPLLPFSVSLRIGRLDMKTVSFSGREGI